MNGKKLERVGVYALIGGGLVMVGGMFVPTLKNPTLSKVGTFAIVGGVLAFIVGLIL